MKLHQDGLNSRQIADYLNAKGVTSWGGKKLYSELVFSVIKKAHGKIAKSQTAKLVTLEIKKQEVL